MPKSNEHKLWIDYWRMAWREKPEVKAFSLYRSVPSLLIAIGQFLVHRQNQPVKEIWTAAIIISGVYLALSVLEAGFNTVVRTPALLDKQRVDKIGEQDRHRLGLEKNAAETREESTRREAELRQTLAERVQEIVRLKSLPLEPKRTPLQEQEYQRIKNFLGNYGESEKKLLRYLGGMGRITWHHSWGLNPPPPGLTHDQAVGLLNKFVTDQMVTKQTNHILGGWENVFQIAPGAEAPLDELL